MKAISVWQPHATLLMLGVKPFETRSWPAWRSLVGQRVCIHAGKALDDLKDLAEYLEDREEFPDEGYEAFIAALKRGGFQRLRDLPRGAILGSAVLESVTPTASLVNPGPFGDFSPGRHAWRFTDHLALPVPLPFRGKQGFFEVPDELLGVAR